jgi:hypothetical protein
MRRNALIVGRDRAPSTTVTAVTGSSLASSLGAASSEGAALSMPEPILRAEDLCRAITAGRSLLRSPN